MCFGILTYLKTTLICGTYQFLFLMSMHVIVSVPTLRPHIEECEEHMEEAVGLDSDEDEQDSWFVYMIINKLLIN